MKYLFSQILVVFLSAIFLLFLFGQETFLPFDSERNIDWYNVSSFLIFFFFLMQGVFSILLFLFQKFFTCGIKEFPCFKSSLKWGFLISLLIIFILFLNIFHFVSLVWGLVIVFVIIVLLLLIKF
jgi:hypothetical protein